MVAFSKVDVLVTDMGMGFHNFTNTASAALKLALTNTAPTAASTVWSSGSFPDPTTNTGGYVTGGNAVAITSFSQTSGTAKLILPDVTFTSTGGSIGNFQYVILYNTSSLSAANKIIGYYNYGSAVMLAATETFTVDFDPTNGALQIVIA